jgi:AcrR family transcriptional regulator
MTPRIHPRRDEGVDAHAHGVTARTRLTRRVRRDEIMAAALRVSADIGYNRITRDDIALAAGCSPALVSELFGTMTALRRQIQRSAVARHVLPVIAQGLALRDPHALRAPAELRTLAAGSLI